MTTTDFDRPEIEAAPEPGSIGAGAEIYRRMERRPQRRPQWMMAVPVVVLAVAAAGGLLAYEAMVRPNAPPPAAGRAQPAAQAQRTPAVPPQAAPVAATPAE